jgi:hypothetical protein
MKKKLLFLFALICSVSIFSSCGDDDKDTTWTQIPDATKENTKLTINGGTLPDATASLDIQSAEAAVLKLTNAIYGHDDISVNVAMVKSNDSTYVFEGTANLDGAISKATAAVDKGLTVAAKGTVTTSGKLTVEVTTSGWGTLSGVYSGDSLKMTVNGAEAKFKKPVTLTAQSETTATLVFEQIPNVVNDFEMEVTLAKDGEGYKFEGTKEMKAGYLVTVSGTIVKNVLTVTVTTSGYATFNKSYSGNDLVYTYNGELMPGKVFKPSVELTFGESTVDINLSNAIKGVYVESTKGSVVIKGVKYTKAADSETYTFSGTASPEGYKASTINFEGTVSPDKVLTLSVDYSIQSDIVGKWNMATDNGLGKTFFDFKTKSGMVNFPDDIYNIIPEDMKKQLPQQMPDEAFVAFVKQMLGQYTMFLNSIEFKSTGNIAFTYTDMKTGKVTTMEQNFVHYSITDKGKLLLVPNMDELFGMMFQSASAQSASLKSYDPYDPTNILSGDGVPFNFEIKNGELRVSLDKGVIEPLGNMLTGFLPILGSFVPAEILSMINVILPGALGMLDEVPTLEIGLYLNK